MLTKSIISFLSLSAATLASGLRKSGQDDHRARPTCHGHESTIGYTTIPGFFLQDDPATDPKTFDYVILLFSLASPFYRLT